MKNKILALALSASFAMTGISSAYANSATPADTTGVTSTITEENNDKTIKKENTKIYQKSETPANIDSKDVPKDATVKNFLIESISEDKTNPTAVLSEADNPESKYSISLDKLQDKNPMVGYMYKIYWDGITLDSYPAQFGKIYKVEPVLLATDEEVKDEATKQSEKREFEVTEVSENGVTLAETSNKDNLYNISLKDLKDEKPVVGDRYMITWSGNSTRSYPAQFIDIKGVEKAMKKDSKKAVNKQELANVIAKAEKQSTKEKGLTEDSVKAFDQAKSKAIEIRDKKNASQEEVDKAANELRKAIDGLTIQNDREMKTSKIYEVVEIKGEGEDKQVILGEKDNKEAIYAISYKELKDSVIKVGDRYEIETNGIILPSNPAQFGKIFNVYKINNDKTIDKSELNKTIMEADKILFGDASYKEETVDNFHKANNQAKKVYENKEASQKEVDEANKNLKDAIKNLAEKDGVIKKKFVLKEIKEKGGKKAVLQSVDYPDKEFSVSLDALNDENPKINDHYMVTIEMVDPEAEPFEMGEITKIEKINEETKLMTPDYSKLVSEVERAEKTFDKNKKYTRESLEAYTKALENAKILIEKNSNDDQDTIDKATRDLKEATNNLKVVEETEIKNEEKKAGNKLGFGNPKTGITPVAPLVVVIGGAAALLKKKFN